MGDGRSLAMFPLSTVLFPYAELPLHVFEPRYQKMVADCLAGEGEFGVVLISRGSEVGGGDHRVNTGTVASLEDSAPLAGGRWLLRTRGTRRIAVRQWLPDDPYPLAVVEEIVPPFADPDGAAALGRLYRDAERAVRRARALLSELGRAPALPAGLSIDGSPDTAGGTGGGTTDEAVWKLCAAAPLTAFDAQRLLETRDSATRLTSLSELVSAVADDLERLLGA